MLPVPTSHTQHSVSSKLSLTSQSFSKQNSRQPFPTSQIKPDGRTPVIFKGTSDDLGFCLSLLILWLEAQHLSFISSILLSTSSPGARSQVPGPFISICCLDPAANLQESLGCDPAAYLMNLKLPLSSSHSGPPFLRWL